MSIGRNDRRIPGEKEVKKRKSESCDWKSARNRITIKPFVSDFCALPVVFRFFFFSLYFFKIASTFSICSHPFHPIGFVRGVMVSPDPWGYWHADKHSHTDTQHTPRVHTDTHNMCTIIAMRTSIVDRFQALLLVIGVAAMATMAQAEEKQLVSVGKKFQPSWLSQSIYNTLSTLKFFYINHNYSSTRTMNEWTTK